MKTNRFFLILALALVFALSACTTVNTIPPTIRQINVTGRGEVYIVPDIAYINVGVQTKSESVSEAVSLNNEQAKAIASALKELGVADKDIQTAAFSVYPQPEYDPEGKLLRTNYMVDNTVYVTVHDLQKMGKMLDAVVKSGANNINSIQFDVQDKTKFLSEARQKAIENARQQAQEMTQSAGVQLGNLITMNVYNSGPSPMPMMARQEAKPMGGASEVPVSAGQLMIAMDANLTYEIK